MCRPCSTSVKIDIRSGQRLQSTPLRNISVCALMFPRHNPYKCRSRTRIGCGVSGAVDLCQSDSLVFVIKTYHAREPFELKSEYQRRVLQEYTLLKGLLHPNIIQAYKKTISFTGSVVEVYLEAGSLDLQKFLSGASRHAPVLHYWKQLCSAVKYLHETAQLCHRDLKLQNMVLVDSTLKLIDFGLATSTSEPAVGIVGTRQYVSPELYLQIRYDGAMADIWSVGIILYYLIKRAFPWKLAIHSDKHYASFKAGQPLELGEAMDSLVYGMLESDPRQRWLILDFDKSPWYTNLTESPKVSMPESGEPHRPT